MFAAILWWEQVTFDELCLKEIFCDMLSYFILIIIAGSKYKCDSLMEDKKTCNMNTKKRHVIILQALRKDK
jgi:hypothetical protein